MFQQKPAFIEELVELCKKHKAIIYARQNRDYKPILSVEVEGLWLDFDRIWDEGAPERGETYWKLIEETAKRVDTWPAWKKG